MAMSIASRSMRTKQDTVSEGIHIGEYFFLVELFLNSSKSTNIVIYTVFLCSLVHVQSQKIVWIDRWLYAMLFLLLWMGHNSGENHDITQ